MIRIGAIVYGVSDIPRAVAFWSKALDYQLREAPEPDWAVLIPKNGNGMQLSLQTDTIPLGEKPERHHMDLFTDDQAAAVERLIALGAQRVEWEYPPDADYVVLADPDGNTFCVVQKG